jgi:catechol 2,3-dioxygenase-like lactoylglutathione lyase family enzyme
MNLKHAFFRMKRTLWICCLAVGSQVLCSAQVTGPNEAGVSMGHLHLNARDVDAQTRFWTAVAGARPAKLGTVDVLELPGVIIFINKKEPTGGTAGSVVDHVGLKVRDLKGTLAKAEAASVKILSSNQKQAMLLAPDDIKVELTLDEAAPDAVAMHHIHFYTGDVENTRQWYVDLFGAIPGKRGPFEAADLPGVNLSFSKASGIRWWARRDGRSITSDSRCGVWSRSRKNWRRAAFTSMCLTGKSLASA